MNIELISLRAITTSHNPRRPAESLQAALETEGYAGYTIPKLIRELALGTPEQKAIFVSLIERYEDGETPDTIVSLAKSRAHKEIQPILLRSFRVKEGEGYVTHYGVVAGERRVLAAAYNHAKHGLPPWIGATSKDMTVDEAFDLAVAENAQRKNMSDYDYAVIFNKYRQRINPATNKKFNLREIAAKFNLDYQFVRGREALAHLPEADQRRLMGGKRVNITNAIRKALKVKRGGKVEGAVVDKSSTRKHVLKLSEVQQLFDFTRKGHLNAQEKTGYLHALATVMRMSIADAMAESDARFAANKQAA
jgi:hypothetical protein